MSDNIETPESESLFAASVEAAIAQGKRESASVEELFEKQAGTAGPEATTPDASKAEAKSETQVQAPSEPAPQQPGQGESLARRLRGLMERERVARETEARVKAQAEEFQNRNSAQEAELAEYRAWKAQRLSDAKRFELDPHGYILSLQKQNPNINPQDIVNRVWGRQLGDLAPTELRQREQTYAAQMSVEQLRAEIEVERAERARQEQDRMAQAQQEQAYHQYVGALKAFAESPLDKYPTLKQYAQGDAERVTQGLYKMAERAYQASNGADMLTPEQAAERLEAQLQKLAERLSPPAPKSVSEPVAPNTPNSLRNSHAATQPDKRIADRGEALFEYAVKQARAAAERATNRG